MADDERTQDADELADFIASLTVSEDADKSATGLELEALESIYPGSISLAQSSQSKGTDADRLRYTVTLPGWEDEDAPRITVLVSLPGDYPASAPLLQIMGRYIGSYPIDAGLFGDVTRTFISASGVPFTPGAVCVFDALVYVQGLVEAWYRAREAEDEEGEAEREGERAGAASTPAKQPPKPKEAAVAASKPKSITPSRPLPSITSSEPIVDRKSSFVGHACRITHEDDVPAVVAHLLSDKRIARAAHPTIWAYRVERDVGGAAGKIVEGDYDDDGETQAGARLKHLLDILDVTGVLVVVTRWFGGIHLGPDRFKHINQAARDALEGAGIIDEPQKKGKGRK